MDSKIFTSSLKSVLRSQGITYDQIAKRLGVSQSTVKRWFSTGGMSLNQYTRVMAIANTKFQDLARLMDSESEAEVYFYTEVQENFLVKHPSVHAFFILLLRYETVSAVRQQKKIPASTISQFLRQLDSLGLIEWKDKFQFRFLVSKKIAWKKDGPLRRQFLAEAKSEFLRSDFSEKLSTFRFLNVQLSERTASDLVSQISKMVGDTNHASEIEKSVNKNLGDFGLLLAIRPWMFSKLRL